MGTGSTLRVCVKTFHFGREEEREKMDMSRVRKS